MSSIENQNPKETGESMEKNSDQIPEKPESKASSFMNLVAEASTLAWNLVIPIVGGVLLGHYIDNRNGSELTWTLSLLVLGVIIAFSNLYNLYVEHGHQKPAARKVKSKDKKAHAGNK